MFCMARARPHCRAVLSLVTGCISAITRHPKNSDWGRRCEADPQQAMLPALADDELLVRSSAVLKSQERRKLDPWRNPFFVVKRDMCFFHRNRAGNGLTTGVAR